MAEPTEPEVTEAGDDKEPTSVRLYLSRLAPQTTKANLEAFFAEYDVQDVVIKDRGEGARRFGFITVRAEAAQKLVDESPHEIDGSSVPIERSRTTLDKRSKPEVHKEEEEEAGVDNVAVRKLFLGGLHGGTGIDDLRTYFSAFGKVVDAVVMIDGRSGRPRGFGFVTFADASSVMRATKDSRYHYIGSRHVEVKPAIPREKMQVASVAEQMQSKLSLGKTDAAAASPTADGAAENFSVANGVPEHELWWQGAHGWHNNAQWATYPQPPPGHPSAPPHAPVAVYGVLVPPQVAGFPPAYPPNPTGAGPVRTGYAPSPTGAPFYAPDVYVSPDMKAAPMAPAMAPPALPPAMQPSVPAYPGASAYPGSPPAFYPQMQPYAYGGG